MADRFDIENVQWGYSISNCVNDTFKLKFQSNN